MLRSEGPDTMRWCLSGTGVFDVKIKNGMFHAPEDQFPIEWSMVCQSHEAGSCLCVDSSVGEDFN
jgi:hypothetical protein